MEMLKKYEKKQNREIEDKFHQLNIGNIGKVIYWLKFIEKIKNVPGDIVICGIGRGCSLLIISAINSFITKKDGGQRGIYAYDSFEGLPEPTIEDKSIMNLKKGDWSKSPSRKYIYSEEFIKKVLIEAGIEINDSSLFIRKGIFCESLKRHPPENIALLSVDCALYKSYLDTLENLYKYVSKGGIIVFDDFLVDGISEDDYPGARKAVKEFFRDKKDKFNKSIGGTKYIVKE
jgi:hypothetical protein